MILDTLVLNLLIYLNMGHCRFRRHVISVVEKVWFKPRILGVTSLTLDRSLSMHNLHRRKIRQHVWCVRIKFMSCHTLCFARRRLLPCAKENGCGEIVDSDVGNSRVQED